MMNGAAYVDENQNSYLEEKFLGEGVTARVYRATNTQGELVALKVMKPDLGERIRSNFSSEADTLTWLNRLEQRRTDGIASVPILHGKQLRDDAPRQFLAMEIVDGIPLDEYLEAHGTLSEADALLVTRQMLRLLGILHREMVPERAYADMQLKNIWLLPADAPPLTGIKVMDWNTLSNPNIKGEPLEQMKRADLALLGAYLYRMVTGKSANPRGEPLRALERRVDREIWESLTYGTRHVIAMALHPDPTRRFRTATEFEGALNSFEEVRALDSAALLDLEKDLESAHGLFKRLPSFDDEDVDDREGAEATVERLRGVEAKIEGYLDEAARRDDVDFALLSNHRARWGGIKRGAGSISWGSIKQFFESGQYRTALKQLDDALRIEGRLEQARWRAAAAYGVSEPEKIAPRRDEITRILQLLDTGDFGAAAQALNTLPPEMAELTAIYQNEIAARRAVERARAAENRTDADTLAQAAEAYKVADASLAALPRDYALILREEESWFDLVQRADALGARAQRLHSKQETASLLEREFNVGFAQGADALQNALVKTPDNEVLVDIALQRARAQRGRSTTELEDKQALLEVLLLFANVPHRAAEIREEWSRATTELRDARAQAKSDEITGEAEALITELTRHSGQGGEMRALVQKAREVRPEHNIPRRAPALAATLEREFKQAIANKSAARADAFLQALQAVDRDREGESANAERLNQLTALDTELKRLQAQRVESFRAEAQQLLDGTGGALNPGLLAERLDFLLALTPAPSPAGESGAGREGMPDGSWTAAIPKRAADPHPHTALRTDLERAAARAHIQAGKILLETLTPESVGKAQEHFANVRGRTTGNPDEDKQAEQGARLAGALMEHDLPELSRIEMKLEDARAESNKGKKASTLATIDENFRQVKRSLYQRWEHWGHYVPTLPRLDALEKAIQDEKRRIQEPAPLTPPTSPEPVTQKSAPALPFPLLVLLGLGAVAAIAAAALSGMNQFLPPRDANLAAEVGTLLDAQTDELRGDNTRIISALEAISTSLAVAPEPTELPAPAPTPTVTVEAMPQPSAAPVNPDTRVTLTLAEMPRQPLLDFPRVLTFTVAEGWLEPGDDGTVRLTAAKAAELGFTDEANPPVQLQVTKPDGNSSSVSALTLNEDNTALTWDTSAWLREQYSDMLPAAGDYILTFMLPDTNPATTLSPDIRILIQSARSVSIPAETPLYNTPDGNTVPTPATADQAGDYVVVGQTLGDIDLAGGSYTVYLAVRKPEGYRQNPLLWVKWEEVGALPDINTDINTPAWLRAIPVVDPAELAAGVQVDSGSQAPTETPTPEPGDDTDPTTPTGAETPVPDTTPTPG